mmetsp:Transcript_3457/g.4583  ORF Transcript_3457/g.4583 Transcript_3457/m.4583 type:complete len:97 (+) Transcript_3457:369-659(+)
MSCKYLYAGLFIATISFGFILSYFVYGMSHEMSEAEHACLQVVVWLAYSFITTMAMCCHVSKNRCPPKSKKGALEQSHKDGHLEHHGGHTMSEFLT